MVAILESISLECCRVTGEAIISQLKREGKDYAGAGITIATVLNYIVFSLFYALVNICLAILSRVFYSSTVGYWLLDMCVTITVQLKID